MLSSSQLFTQSKGGEKTDNDLPPPTKQMEEFFDNRTKAHIQRVKKNMELMVGYQGLSLEILSERGDAHDKSKFSPPERTGYIWLSWMHHCKNNAISFKYPLGIQAEVDQACEHHFKNNLHHVEAHKSPEEMSILDLVEMVCDWTAISQEYNQNDGSCKKYVDNNIDKKWHFPANIKTLIYEIIDELDKRIRLSANQVPQFKK